MFNNKDMTKKIHVDNRKRHKMEQITMENIKIPKDTTKQTDKYNKTLTAVK